MGSALLLLKSVGGGTTPSFVTIVAFTGKAKDGTTTVAITHDFAVIPTILFVVAPVGTVLEGDEAHGVLAHDRAHPSAGVGYRGVRRGLAVAVLLADADDAEENVLIGCRRGSG